MSVAAGSTVVLLALGGVYTVVTGGSETPTGTATAGVALEDEADATASADASGEAEGEAEEGSGGIGAASADGQDNDGAGKVDKLTPVVVLNSLSVMGLAGEYRTQLEDKGWTVSRTDNSDSKNLSVSQILYEDSSMEASAKAVRKALGGLGELSESSVNPGSITVVLGQDTQ
ncbi:hypothetical protein GCM10027456_67310 [Kineosporia babensis]